MPLVGPALSALAIFTFLGNWTAFLWPLISTTRRELYTLPVGLASFSGEFQREWEMVMAGASVATLPVLLLFVLLQKYIVRGVMLAGIKGRAVSAASGEERFPAAVYRDTVLAPLFEGVKQPPLAPADAGQPRERDHAGRRGAS